jgi:hypothetical protein
MENTKLGPGVNPRVRRAIIQLRGMLIAPTGAGQIFYVDATSGSDGNDGENPDTAKATIQAAVDICGDGRGDMIIVGPGKYQENVIIEDHDALQLIALFPGWDTRIRPSDGTTKYAFSNSGGTTITADGIGIIISSRSVTIDGFCLDGGGGYVGAYVGDGYGVTGAGGTSYNSASARIRNCLFRAGNEGTNTPGLVLKGCGGNVIVENNVFRTNDFGVLVSPGSGRTCQGPMIKNNIFMDCSTYGVYTDNVNTIVNVLVENNTFLDGAQTLTYAILTQGTGVHTIANNRFGCTNKISCQATDWTAGNYTANGTGTPTFISET